MPASLRTSIRSLSAEDLRFQGFRMVAGLVPQLQVLHMPLVGFQIKHANRCHQDQNNSSNGTSL